MPGCTGEITQKSGYSVDFEWEKSQDGFIVASFISVLSFCRHGIGKAIALAHGCCLNFRKVCIFFINLFCFCRLNSTILNLLFSFFYFFYQFLI